MYSAFTKEQVKVFVGKFGDTIVKTIANQGLFFPAVIGQLTVESKWGASDLSAKYGNYGGIQATGSQFSSGKVTLDTSEYVNGKLVPAREDFATYDSFANFMADYVRVLHLPHFINAGVFSAPSPSEQVLAIGKGGYSTADPAKYLSFAQGRIEACIDSYPWGKIDSTVPNPGEIPGSAGGMMGAIMASVNSSLSGVLGNGSKLQPIF